MGEVRKTDNQIQTNPEQVTSKTNISKQNEIATSATLDQLLKLIETIDQKHKITKTEKQQIEKIGSDHPGQVIALLAQKHPELVKNAISQFVASDTSTEEEKLTVLQSLINQLPEGEQKEKLQQFFTLIKGYKDGDSLEDIANNAKLLKSSGSSDKAESSKDPDNFLVVLAQVNASLQKALASAEKTANQKAQLQKQMADANTKSQDASLTKQLADAKQQAADAAKAKQQQENMKIAMICVGVALAIVGAVIAGVTGGLAAGLVAGLVGVFFAVAAGPIENAMVKGIKPMIKGALQDLYPNMSADDLDKAADAISKVVADVTVAAIAIVCTLGIGSVSTAADVAATDTAEAVGEDTLEAAGTQVGEEVADNVAESAGQESANVVSSEVEQQGTTAAKKLSEKILEQLKKVLMDKGFTKKVAGTIVSTLGQAGVFNDITSGIVTAAKTAAEDANPDLKTDEKFQITMALTGAIVGAACSIAAGVGGGMTAAKGEAQTLENLGGESGAALQKILNRVGNVGKKAADIAGAITKVGASTVSAGFQASLTKTQLSLASDQEAVGQSTSDALVSNILSKLQQSQTQSMTKEDQSVIKELQDIITKNLQAMKTSDAAMTGLQSNKES